MKPNHTSFGNVTDTLNGKIASLRIIFSITNGSIIIIGLVYILLVISLVVTLSFKNTYELAETFDYTTINTVYVVILMVVGISFMPRISPFIYFNF